MTNAMKLLVRDEASQRSSNNDWHSQLTMTWRYSASTSSSACASAAAVPTLVDALSSGNSPKRAHSCAGTSADQNSAASADMDEVSVSG